MSEQITRKQLEGLCAHLNKITNSPAESYSKGEDGNYHANPGNYHISGAYGGVNLERIVNDGGGVSQPIGGGYMPKRELYYRLRAYIHGIEDGKR